MEGGGARFLDKSSADLDPLRNAAAFKDCLNLDLALLLTLAACGPSVLGDFELHLSPSEGFCTPRK